MLAIGIFSALGLLLLALKIGGRKTIGHDVFVDVLITLTLMVAFYGTFSGMAAAMVGGLVATIVLFIMKKTMVHQKFVVTTKPTKVLNFTLHTPRGKWEERQPDWRNDGQSK
jgi:hypothetical protein